MGRNAVHLHEQRRPGGLGRDRNEWLEWLLVLAVLLEIAMLFEPSRESKVHLILEIEDIDGCGSAIDAKLENASSVSSLLLMTEALVAEKPKKEEPHSHGAPDMGGMGF